VNPAVIVLSLLLFTSVIMTIAMAIAWLHFGRQTYVWSWTLAYAAAVSQWGANLLGFSVGAHVSMAFSAPAIVVSGSLIAIGVRQRAGRPIGWGWMVAMGGIVSLIGIVAALAPGAMPLRGMVVPAYVGLMMGLSAQALRPSGRPFSAPEGALFTMLLLLAIFYIALAAAAARVTGFGPGQGVELYRAIIGMFLPSIYVGTGVAAVLVVAGDLAQQLRRQVSHDSLTGILNRRGMEEAAVRAIANARRSDQPLSIVICDLDGFKAVNDGHGHIAGDAALRGFAQLLTNAVRRGDIVARMGGDEFGLLLIDTDAAATADVMERVRTEILCLSLPQAPRAMLSASFGIAEIESGDAQLDDMVARADRALYDAKKGGKDRVAIWQDAA
jgi:diguanylate cyclase (GGDEF)-like protein